MINGKTIHLGRFTDKKEAELKYKNKKIEILKQL